MPITTGQQLIDAVRLWLRRYVGLSPAQELTLALWALHTWCYERISRTTPYVEITGVTGSGKTTCMEALSLLSRGALITNTIRTMFICRRVAETEGKLSLFVDEAEKLESASFGDQRSMLASGYRRGGVHGVTVGKGTETFPVWCPKVFTSLRTVTDVLHNRCIPIWMERGKTDAVLAQEWERAEATAYELIEAYRRISPALHRASASANVDKLRALGLKVPDAPADSGVAVLPFAPDHLHSERDFEIWTPLFTLAQTLGASPATMKELTAASVDLSSLRGIQRRMDSKVEDAAAKEKSYAVRLLQDVRTVAVPGEVAIPTEDLLKRLHGLETAPWRVYQRHGLTSFQLAELLGAFGLESKDKRFGKGRKASKVLKAWIMSEVNAVKL